MAKLMTSINQIEGGDILKSGDVTSLFGFEILGADGKRMDPERVSSHCLMMKPWHSTKM